MAVPDFQSMMYPLLKYASDGKEHGYKDFKKFIRDHFNLTNDDINETINSGAPRYTSNLRWAVTFLHRAGLLTRVKDGIYAISQDGVSYLQQIQSSKQIRIKDLRKFESFRKFESSSKNNKDSKPTRGKSETTYLTEKNPDESIEESYKLIRSDLAKKLLDTIKDHSPEFFESLVVDLLIKMGYGDFRPEAGQVVGKSGDGGIDGIINEDKLGLDIIYIQAKRYDGDATVPISDVRDFAGALSSKKSHKGIFLTTSSFPKSAKEFVDKCSHQIILIDGEKLAGLMIEHNVGVSVRKTYQIKRIDLDYFNEDDM